MNKQSVNPILVIFLIVLTVLVVSNWSTINKSLFVISYSVPQAKGYCGDGSCDLNWENFSSCSEDCPAMSFCLVSSDCV